MSGFWLLVQVQAITSQQQFRGNQHDEMNYCSTLPGVKQGALAHSKHEGQQAGAST